MSSLLDAVLNSDAAAPSPAPSSQLAQTPYSTAQTPRPPPSESNHGNMSDPENGPGFADDEVPDQAAMRRRFAAGLNSDVPKVVDMAGQKVMEAFQGFLEQYTEMPTSSAATAPMSSADYGDKYYIAQIHGLKKYSLSTLYVDFQHLMALEDSALADAIVDQYLRFQPFLTRALHNLIAKYEPQYFRDHRQMTSSTSSQTNSSVMANGHSEDDSTETSEFKGRNTNQQTDKVFALAFYNLPLVSRLRQLKTRQIGKLVSVSGTVTRTSEVRPELSLATFRCEECNTIISNVEQVFKYTTPSSCPQPLCNNKELWKLDIRQSTFVDWQKVRMQESSSEIPTGSMPRTIDVIFRGEMVDRAKAGERVLFTGSLICIPDISQIAPQTPQLTRDTRDFRGDAGGNGVTGLKSLGVRDLTYRMAFLACMVTPDFSTPGQPSNTQLSGHNILSSLNQASNQDEYARPKHEQEALLQSMTPAEIADLRHMVHSEHIYARLVQSIAPTVFGHQNIKKGVLLQLLSGVSKSTPEGMQLRGDINICIVGDPSTSKSQMLKYVCSFLPRAVYTSGKASSAAGLTASVIKDEESGEFTIEAGALLLGDKGVVCIDEFDKMDIKDQVAIHEAMEQQTISIAKAGIQATLNARTSILAAANPVGGRYDRRKTLRANVNMTAPIMSRFDLFYVILDEPSEAVDRRLAEHIVGLHQNKDEAIEPEFSTEQLQRYIRFARTFKPVFTDEAKTLLVEKYRELRANDAQGGIGTKSYRITVRQLESLIRLSEAIAKANCVDQIVPAFVREAHALLSQSIITVDKDDIEVDEDDDNADVNGDEDDAEMMDGLAGGAPAGTGADDEEYDASARDPSQTPAPRRPKTKITYEKYMKILNLLVQRVNADELAAGTGVSEHDLTVWYLEQIEDELQSEEDLAAEQDLCRKVLKRLIKENVLMAIRGTIEDGEAAEGAETEGTVYVLHPNCSVDVE